MSKCKPCGTTTLMNLEKHGVTLSDVTQTHMRSGGEETLRHVTITIPYDALREQEDVQRAFQDLVLISSTP